MKTVVDRTIAFDCPMCHCDVSSQGDVVDVTVFSDGTSSYFCTGCGHSWEAATDISYMLEHLAQAEQALTQALQSSSLRDVRKCAKYFRQQLELCRTQVHIVLNGYSNLLVMAERSAVKKPATSDDNVLKCQTTG